MPDYQPLHRYRHFNMRNCNRKFDNTYHQQTCTTQREGFVTRYRKKGGN